MAPLCPLYLISSAVCVFWFIVFALQHHFCCLNHRSSIINNVPRSFPLLTQLTKQVAVSIGQEYLDISVNDVVVVAIAQRLQDLSHVVTEREQKRRCPVYVVSKKIGYFNLRDV